MTMSRPPNCLLVEAIAVATSSGFAISACTTICPVPQSPVKVSLAAASLERKRIATLAPRSAKAFAIARPIPREPPVTNTFLPSNSELIFSWSRADIPSPFHIVNHQSVVDSERNKRIHSV